MTRAAPQVPGEQTQTESENQGQSSAPAANQMDEMVSVPKSTLDELLARVKNLEASAARPAAKQVNPEANLPDQETVDVKKLKGPVLTKQGWIVPEGYGEVKAKAK